MKSLWREQERERGSFIEKSAEMRCARLVLSATRTLGVGHDYPDDTSLH
jgi:hypothetical protein